MGACQMGIPLISSLLLAKSFKKRFGSQNRKMIIPTHYSINILGTADINTSLRPNLEKFAQF